MPVPMPRAKTDAPPKGRKATGSTGSTGNRSTRSNRSATEDVPPRASGESAPPPPPKAAPKPRAGSLEARLGEFLGICSFPFAAAGDQYSARIIALRSPALAEALAELAKENAAVKRVLERVLEGSAWGAVGLASASIILPICQHHGIIPGSDPFAAIMPSPDKPPRMKWGNQSSNGSGSTMGAPGPGSEGDPSTPDSAGDYVPHMDGAPPGVVTVAATAAQHAGAR